MIQGMAAEPWVRSQMAWFAVWAAAAVALLALSLRRERRGGKGFKKLAILPAVIAAYFSAQVTGAILLPVGVAAICNSDNVSAC
jgi:ABC-type Co2+ transport system permease subunit